MKKVYESIIATGTKNNFSNNLNKKIRLLNIYSLVWSHIVLVFLSLEMFINLIGEVYNKKNISFDFFDLKYFLIHIFIVILLVGVLFINKYLNFKWGRILFLSTFGFANIYAALFISPGSFIEYYFLLMSPIAITLF